MDQTSRLVADLTRLTGTAVRELLEGDRAELRATAKLIHHIAGELIEATRNDATVAA